MHAAFLPDRGVVKVSGEDARNFLNGLVTTDVAELKPGPGADVTARTCRSCHSTDYIVMQPRGNARPTARPGITDLGPRARRPPAALVGVLAARGMRCLRRFRSPPTGCS